jgi:hypothetical protein
LLRWTVGDPKNFVREELHSDAGLRGFGFNGCDRGELDAGVEGVVIWFYFECGARIARRADGGDVDA